MPVQILTSSLSQLRHALLEVVWRQWDAVGAMAAVETRATNLVDPEALILMSLTLLEDEPRLADLAASWMTLNSALVSVQRMKNLMREYPAATAAKFAALARIAVERGKDFRWRELIEHAGAGSFPYRTNKIRSIPARLDLPAAWMLRLRAGFGVGVRADLLAYLVSTAPSAQSVRAITNATRYTQAPTRRAIADLVAAAFIRASADDSGTARYAVDARQWSALLGARRWPQWQGWHEMFVFGEATFAFRRQLSSIDDEAAASALARRLFGQHRRVFARLDTASHAMPDQPGAFVDFFAARTAALAGWAVAAV